MKRLAGSLNELGPLLGTLALLAAELRQRMAHPGQPRPEQHLAVLIHDEPTSATKYTYRVYNPPTVSGYRSSLSRTRIPTTDYTITCRRWCADPDSNFLDIGWNGQPDGFKNIWNEPSNGFSNSGIWYGHDGARSGYFDVGTQATCSWTFTVTYRGWR